MTIDAVHAEMILKMAVDAFPEGDAALESALDRIGAPIYVTDQNGTIVYFNAACVPFAGRTPQVGRDNWCVTWRLYTTEGVPLPHDRCPMAVAVHERRSVRGERAIAERPDGSRVAFVPYPTPLVDAHGVFAGAVNLLVDVTEDQESYLRSEAARCRRLAAGMNDQRTVQILTLMAAEYAERAETLARRPEASIYIHQAPVADQGSQSESQSFLLQDGGTRMCDDATLRSPQDRTRVAMGEDREVRYWTERFGISREDLQRAVDEVGVSVDAIKRRLAG